MNPQKPSSNKTKSPTADHRKGLAAWSMGRPVTVVMLVLTVVVMGLVASFKLPLQIMPTGLQVPWMTVFIPYPNSNPAEVEEKILKPLEEALRTVPNIKSTMGSARSDYLWCGISFQPNTDMTAAYNAVRDRVERLRATFPEDVDRIQVRRSNPDDDPILEFGVQLPESVEDPHDYIQRYVVRRLERIPGVAQVGTEGVQEKILRIELDLEKVQRHNIDIYALSSKLRTANFTVPGGNITESGKKLFLRSVGTLTTPEEIEALPVPGTKVRLGDVGEVVYGAPLREKFFRIDGRDAFAINVQKESSANTAEVCKRINLELEKIKNDPGTAGIGFVTFFDQGETITDTILALGQTGLFGGILAIIFLFVFLRRFRLTLIITLAIPLSILIALVVMYFNGMSYNLITLLGLMLSIGMLVDNSVVVTENIARLRQLGLSGTEAALKGTREVALAITMSTLTTVVVFLPTALLAQEAEMRFYLTVMTIPICTAIVGSLLISLVLIPLGAKNLLKSDMEAHSKFTTMMDKGYEKTLGRLNTLYPKALAWFLDHRLQMVALVIIVAVATVAIPMKKVKFDTAQGGNGRTIGMNFSMPGSWTLDQTSAFFERVETVLEEHREDWAIRTFRASSSTTWGRMRVFLKESNETDVSMEKVIEELKPLLPTEPGVQTFTRWARNAGAENDIQIRIHGEDTAKLTELAEEAARRLRQLDSVVDVSTDLDEKGSDEIVLSLDRGAAMQYGVDPDTVVGTLTNAVRGIQLPRVRTGEKEIQVRLSLREEDRETVDQIRNLRVPTKDGEVPLSALGQFTFSRAPGNIFRHDGKTSMTLTINTFSDDMKQMRKDVNQVVATMNFPVGYGLIFGERFRRGQNPFADVIPGLTLSIVFIFLLMGVLFESWALPISVMPSIPLAFVGVFWLLFATGTPLNQLAILGFILLPGIVVNNAIVLIDRVNQMRWEGLTRRQAILDAAKTRLRPILVTALTTIAGLLPMAFGTQEMVGMSYNPMGQFFVGGLALGTILTLFVVPMFYTYVDDLRFYFMKLLGSVDASADPDQWMPGLTGEREETKLTVGLESAAPRDPDIR